MGNRVVEGDILPAGSITGRNYLPWSFRFCACRPRRHKLRIACFRLTAKIRSLHCASFPHRTRCAGLRRGPRAAGQESSCFSFPLAVYGLAKTCGKGLVLPPAAEVAPSETEGAGQSVGTFQVSAKADKSLAERSKLSLFAKERPFLLDRPRPVFFSARRKENGGWNPFPPRPGARNLPGRGHRKENGGAEPLPRREA